MAQVSIWTLNSFETQRPLTGHEKAMIAKLQMLRKKPRTSKNEPSAVKMVFLKRAILKGPWAMKADLFTLSTATVSNTLGPEGGLLKLPGRRPRLPGEEIIFVKVPLPVARKGHFPATRSGSAADPYLAEQLSAVSNPKNIRWNVPRLLPGHAK